MKELCLKKNGAETQTCTGDARIFSPALYYLSYLGIICGTNEKPILLKKPVLSICTLSIP